MAQPPLDPKRSIIRLRAACRSALSGALLAVGAMIIYFTYLSNGESFARGVAMVTVVIGSILLTFAEIAGDQRWRISLLPRDARAWSNHPDDRCHADSFHLHSTIRTIAGHHGAVMARVR